MNGTADPCSSVLLKVQILCRLERILLRGFFALFASSRLIPDSAFTAKTRRTQRKREEDQFGCGSAVSMFIRVQLWFHLCSLREIRGKSFCRSWRVHRISGRR